MNLRLNHLQEQAGVNAELVARALDSLVAEGRMEPSELKGLHVELDWIQYKQNFRDPVSIAQTYNGNGKHPPVTEVRIDTRQVAPDSLQREMIRAFAGAESNGDGELANQFAFRPAKPLIEVPASELDRLPVEDFKSFRYSIAWRFNEMYWRNFTDWQHWTGHSYEKALPGGASDGHNLLSIADGVADFWTLLKDLEARGELPQEVFLLEIGVGTGTRCGLFLDQFQALDQKRGTHFYPRLRVLLGDYSIATLDSSRPSVGKHIELCSFLVLDALHPMKSLAFLRNKVQFIHTTNVYDNLPDEEYVRRDGRLYLVQSRAYLRQADVERISGAAGVPLERFRYTVERLVESGPDYFPDHAAGMTFWQDTWKAMRLEERLISIDDLAEPPLPGILEAADLEKILADAPRDFRFHLSPGAIRSFANTVPLLHPRGYFQVQDIFVQEHTDFLRGFRGPGKLDGSIVNWVNGAMLKAVADKLGCDAHFAPFIYRKGAHTSVLYASRRN